MIIFHSWIGFDPHRIRNFTLGNSVKIQESQVWKVETLGGVSKFRRRQTTVTDDGKVGGHGGVGHAQGGLGDLHGGGGEAGARPLAVGDRSRGVERGRGETLFAQRGRGSVQRPRGGVGDVAGDLRQVVAPLTVQEVDGDVHTRVALVLVINSFHIIIG